jgi:hypothetical protein
MRTSARDVILDDALKAFSTASYDSYAHRRVLHPAATKTFTLLIEESAAPLAELESRLIRRRSAK